MTATPKRKEAKTDAKPKPALRIQVGGVRIPIWLNEGEDGEPYYKAGQPELSYRGSDGNWHTGKSYGAFDLINLIKAAALAHSEITRRNRPTSSEAEETAEAADEAE